MNAQNIQKVGIWTALAGAIAALFVIANSSRRSSAFKLRSKKYDDIFGI